MKRRISGGFCGRLAKMEIYSNLGATTFNFPKVVSYFSFRVLFYSSTSEIFSNATETNEEKFLSIFCWGKFLLVYYPWMEEVVATGPGRRVYT